MDRIYLIFEVLAILFCLFGLYGQKFQWNIYTILFIGLEVMFCYAANMYDFVRYFKPIIYLLLLVYMRIQFKGKWRDSIINYILCILISLILQLICYFPVMILGGNLFIYRYLVINVLLFVSNYILYKSKILYWFSKYMNQKSKIILAVLVILLSFGVFGMYTMKIYTQFRVIDYVILISSVVLLFITIFLLQRERMINQQMKIEKNMNQLYGNALAELIEKVRVNQHNYKNQLVAIQGMVYTAKNLDDLKREQEKYYHSIQKEEKYSNLLSGNSDPVVAGFIYSKLCNNDTYNVDVRCFYNLSKKENSLFLSDIVQILGVLIDNAFEKVEKEQYTHKGISIIVTEENGVKIEVCNICRKISTNEISDFFRKGHSTKGQGRGLGLFGVKELVKKWDGEIVTQNREINEENWLSICIVFPKNKRL